jgi:hypothetical protein
VILTELALFDVLIISFAALFVCFRKDFHMKKTANNENRRGDRPRSPAV